jgi:hypothetical protein
MTTSLHLTRYPSGRFGFVGRIPQALAYEGDADMLAIATQCGPGFAERIAKRQGLTFRYLSWASAEEACAAAKALGFEVAG